MVPWMSGLVSGLQNRLRRFEPARNLIGFEFTRSLFFVPNFFIEWAVLHEKSAIFAFPNGYLVSCL